MTAPQLLCHCLNWTHGLSSRQPTKLHSVKAMRNTWELNPEQFALRNPLWQQYLDGIVATVAESLGIENGAETVQAELYKMLLYEKGAMFKAHKE
jgi:hypothetical protein